jgi:hypothetical protein
VTALLIALALALQRVVSRVAFGAKALLAESDAARIFGGDPVMVTILAWRIAAGPLLA